MDCCGQIAAHGEAGCSPSAAPTWARRADSELVSPLAELHATERQAAEEASERLNAGRRRAREAALQEAAVKEGKGGQVLNAGTQTSS